VRKSPAFSAAASHWDARKFVMYIPKKWVQQDSNLRPAD
jgi:hypothetical protein